MIFLKQPEREGDVVEHLVTCLRLPEDVDHVGRREVLRLCLVLPALANAIWVSLDQFNGAHNHPLGTVVVDDAKEMDTILKGVPHTSKRRESDARPTKSISNGHAEWQCLVNNVALSDRP